MLSNNKKLIAVIGATGQQGGGVVRVLQANGQFKVRALTRNPDKHREPMAPAKDGFRASCAGWRLVGTEGQRWHSE